MTVQSVLRNKSGFREATRRRVFKKAKELSYRPNWVARSLATRKTLVIGVAVPNLGRPFFPLVLEGIDAITHAAGYNLVVFNTDEDAAREDEGIAALIDRQVDGLIIASSHHRTNNGSWGPIRESGVPFVLIDRFFPSVPFVGAENQWVGTMATRHLIEQGYRAIGHITGRPHLMTGFGRYRGYVKALREAGLRVRRDLIVEVEYNTEAGGYAGAKQLMNLRPRPDAIFAINDLVAIGAMQAVREFGLRAPEDFGMISVGNIPYSEHLRIPLSSVDLHPIETGKSAASILLGMIGGKQAPRNPVFIEPTLVVRASSCRYSRAGSRE